MDDIALKDMIPMLRSLGISPEQLGPDKMERLKALADKVGDPSSMDEGGAIAIMRELGIGLGGEKKERPPRGPKIGRNDKCPCDGGKKFKHCCGRY